MRMDRAFDVFCGALDVDIAVANKLLESAQGVLFLILRLNLDRRTVVQRHRAPAKRLHVLHGEVEELLVGQSIRELPDSKIARLLVHNRHRVRDWLVREMNTALADRLLKNGEEI